MLIRWSYLYLIIALFFACIGFGPFYEAGAEISRMACAIFMIIFLSTFFTGASDGEHLFPNRRKAHP